MRIVQKREQFKGLYVPLEFSLDYNRLKQWACMDHTNKCYGIDCENCLFQYNHREIFQEWIDLNVRTKKLERILNETI